MADAGIACWDSKYRYVFWRPITAIRNGLTPAVPDWVPWLDFVLFFDLRFQGIVVDEIFFGLWLFPLALLVYRSRFLPRVLGV